MVAKKVMGANVPLDGPAHMEIPPVSGGLMAAATTANLGEAVGHLNIIIIL